MTASFDMSRATLKPREAAYLFIVTHNGEALQGESFGSHEAAALRSWKLSEELGTDISCFSIQRVPL